MSNNTYDKVDSSDNLSYRYGLG